MNSQLKSFCGICIKMAIKSSIIVFCYNLAIINRGSQIMFFFKCLCSVHSIFLFWKKFAVIYNYSQLELIIFKIHTVYLGILAWNFAYRLLAIRFKVVTVILSRRNTTYIQTSFFNTVAFTELLWPFIDIELKFFLLQ